MRKSFLSFIFALFALCLHAAQKPIKVACVGNSITFGYLLDNPSTDSYPSQLQKMLGNGYVVGNFGHSGATLLNHGHRPYTKQKEYTEALNYKADIVVIHLGVNDTDPRNWPFYRDEFVPDYISLVNSFKKANPKVHIIIARMSPLTHQHFRFLAGTRDWHKDIQKEIEYVAGVVGAQLIDFYEPLISRPSLLPDAVHPNKEGATILANVVYQAITGDFGGLKMPLYFGDNMVVDWQKPFVVNGTANAKSRVLVQLNNQKKTVEVGTDGQWQVVFSPLELGKNYTLKVSDKQTTLTFKDLVAGEVWVCSGQSNMEFPLSHAINAKEALPQAQDSLLRFLHFKPRWDTDDVSWSATALDSINKLQYFESKGWTKCNPKTARSASAVAYFFGKMLRDSLKMPIGLVMNAVGGSTTESWIDRPTLENNIPELLNDRYNKHVMVMPWVMQRRAKNVANGKNPLQLHPYNPTYLYDSAIRPLRNMNVNGVIWYQGESNATNIEIHERLFPLLIQSWRSFFADSSLPFYYVQLSSINRPSWPWFRDSQRTMMQQLPNTGMAVSSDLGDSLNVHPRNKQPIGERLARWALLKHKGFEQIVPSGPLFVGAKMQGKKVVVEFKYGKNLTTADNQPLRTLELAGADKVFYPAKTILKDGVLEAWSDSVQQPKFVRYAYQPFTRGNLVNSDKLPASTFLSAISAK